MKSKKFYLKNYKKGQKNCYFADENCHYISFIFDMELLCSGQISYNQRDTKQPYICQYVFVSKFIFSIEVYILYISTLFIFIIFIFSSSIKFNSINFLYVREYQHFCIIYKWGSLLVYNACISFFRFIK